MVPQYREVDRLLLDSGDIVLVGKVSIGTVVSIESNQGHFTFPLTRLFQVKWGEAKNG